MNLHKLCLRAVGGRVCRSVGKCVAGLLVAMAMASPAAAQLHAQLDGDARPYLQWVIGVGVIIFALLVGFLNAKRSHLD